MRYLMTFSYDGSNFYGYQVQNNKRTVQGEIEKELSRINGNKKVKIVGSGRTDRGVHAIGQRAHFDFKEMDPLKLKSSLNKLLPEDIYIKNIEVVNDDFHARFDVIKKEYIYIINIGEYNPIKYNYEFQLNKELNIIKMQKAAKYLIGEHNFKSFTKNDEEKEDFVRTIFDIEFIDDNNVLIIKFIGSGFLRYMVRNIVGLLVEVGLENVSPEITKDILESHDRTKAFKTFSPNGLYLNKVYY